MRRIVIATLCGLCAGFLSGSATMSVAQAADDPAGDDWQNTKPFLWDGLQPFHSDWQRFNSFRAVPVEMRTMRYFEFVSPALAKELAAFEYHAPQSVAVAPQEEELAKRARELEERAAELRQQAQRLEQARREVNQAREQLERERRGMFGPPDHDQSPEHHPDHAPPPGMEMIQHMEIINAMAERLSNPHTAAMLGIAMAKEHLKPEERYELLTGVLKEIDGPPAIRNAAMLVLMETCHELGRDDEGRKLLSAMIVENAKRAK